MAGTLPGSEASSMKVDYLVHMHECRRKKRAFHINMLRKWYLPASLSYMAEELPVGDDDDGVPVWNDGQDMADDKPTVGEQLDQEQYANLQKLLGDFSDVFQNKPGLTTLSEHHITTGSAHPVRLPPYCLP